MSALTRITASRRIRGLVAAGSIAAALFGTVAAAAPASAATTYGYVSVCYKTIYGGATSVTPRAQTSTDGVNWSAPVSKAGTSSGCYTWTVTSGKYIRLYALDQVNYQGHIWNYQTYGYSAKFKAVAGTTISAGSYTADWYLIY